MEHQTEGETADELNISHEKCAQILRECRGLLREERLKRPAPHLDDKMVAVWNGKFHDTNTKIYS